MRATGPLFSYYGAKWRAAVKYPSPLPGLPIVEPFAGSACYALRMQEPGQDVILVEKDPRIAAVWRWLIAATPDDVMGLPLLEPGQKVRDLSLPDAAAWLIGFLVVSGASQPKQSVTSWDKRDASTWGVACRERLARNVRLVSHWTLLEGHYSDVADVNGTWFIDPPYQAQGRHYKHGSAGLDYAALGAWCRSRRGQVIVCEQNGADWLPFVPVAAVKAGRHRYSREVAWVRVSAQHGPLFQKAK